MNRLIFITGGARSGKSTFAEELAKKINNSYPEKNMIAYIATGEVMDDEFKKRIEEHQKRRGADFLTFEEPLDIGSKVEFSYPNHNVIIVECLTTWLANLYFREPELKDMLIKSNLNNMISLFTGKLNPITKIENIVSFLSDEFVVPSEQLFENHNLKDKTLIVVSNEIGLGVVPDNKMSRDFRDELGRINKITALNAHYVFQCVSGIPNRIK